MTISTTYHPSIADGTGLGDRAPGRPIHRGQLDLVSDPVKQAPEFIGQTAINSHTQAMDPLDAAHIRRRRPSPALLHTRDQLSRLAGPSRQASTQSRRSLARLRTPRTRDGPLRPKETAQDVDQAIRDVCAGTDRAMLFVVVGLQRCAHLYIFGGVPVGV